MNKPTSTSLIKILENVSDELNEKSMHDHIMIVLESDENGLPNGKIVKVKGHPFGLLGMIDLITEQLSAIREGIIEKFNNADKMNDTFKSATSSHRARLQKLEDAARKAAENGDDEKLDAIKIELINLLKEMKFGNSDGQDDDDNDGSSDSGEFRIDDFKGSF